MRRRDLLLLATLSPLASSLARAAATRTHVQPETRTQRTLVLIELKGGNDGLNTLVPYADPIYYRLRPRLAIPAERVMCLDESVGMHPALAPLMPAWRDGDLVWVQGLGYANPNKSHFRSLDIWETASDADEELHTGWLTQFLPPHAGEAWPDVLILGGDDGAAKGDALRVVTMQTSERFLKRAERLSTIEQRAATTDALNHIQSVQSEIRYTAAEMQEKLDRSADSFTEFPRTHLGRQLREAARILVAGVEIPVIKVTIAGFDTHSNQLSRHERLLTELAEALAAFRIAMINKQYWDRLLLMTYSEFGRRVAENQSRGTDHGTAAPHLVIGGKVKGGLYGTAPTLTQLDADNLQYTTDYRRLYATIVRRWWHLSEARWHQRFQAMDWI